MYDFQFKIPIRTTRFDAFSALMWLLRDNYRVRLFTRAVHLLYGNQTKLLLIGLFITLLSQHTCGLGIRVGIEVGGAAPTRRECLGDDAWAFGGELLLYLVDWGAAEGNLSVPTLLYIMQISVDMRLKYSLLLGIIKRPNIIILSLERCSLLSKAVLNEK